jgi:hypothetical protein
MHLTTCGEREGKTAFLHLKIVEFIINGRPFLYQTMHGAVYHVSRTVTLIDSWPSNKGITAFIDGDQTYRDSCVPKSFLVSRYVQLIVASSPEGTNQKWQKQLGNIGFVTELVSALWSPEEFFLTGFVIPLQA